MRIAYADAAAPFVRTGAVDPHKTEHPLTVSGQTVLFVDYLPVTGVNRTGYRFDHLTMRDPASS